MRMKLGLDWLEQDFGESDARRSISNKFKPSVIWGEKMFPDVIQSLVQQEA